MTFKINLFTTLKEINQFRFVLLQLIRQQLILRYRRTVFGYLWTLLNPILMMTVTAVVFSALFKVDLKTFAVFLFAGMIPWNCFNSMVTQSATAFISNEGLIKKIYLPKLVFPLSICLSVLVDSMLSFIALMIIIFLISGQSSWALLFIPVAYILLFLFSFGIALIISTMTVFFRDMQHVIGIALQALFFLSPILYKTSSLAGKVAWIVKINPISAYIDLFRSPVNLGVLPETSVIVNASILSFLSVIIGLVFFMMQENKIVYRL